MTAKPDHNDPASAASRFRRRRFERLNALIRDIVARRGRARILDIGGRRGYWQMLAPDLVPKVSVTLLNLPGEFQPGKAEGDALDVTYRHGDGCAMPEFADGAFDLAHSNSVIEHVGSLGNMIRFADETRRVGAACYLQTPYLWFPVEPHFGFPLLHWLPGPTRAQLNHRFRLGRAGRCVDYRVALVNADHIQMADRFLIRALFPDADLHAERFLLMTKSLIAIRPLPPG